MDRESFRKYLLTRNASEEQIEQSFKIVEKLERFQQQSGSNDNPVTGEEFAAFSAQMIDQGENTFENYLALARYGRFTHNNDLFLPALDLLDGCEVFDNLYKKVGEEIGSDRRDEIFRGFDIPAIGTPHEKKTEAMQAALQKLEAAIGQDPCKKILASGLRDLPDEEYQDAKNKYLECGNIDEYLKRKGDEFIEELKEIKDSHGLFFNQEITDEVIAFVESQPEIRQGVRVGNVIYEMKIPYQAKEYLAETNPDKKRYYFCHCPWAKSSLKDGASSMTPIFCNCSAAYHKKPYDVIFGRPLKAEVLESVLLGDMRCRFAIYLPEEAV